MEQTDRKFGFRALKIELVIIVLVLIAAGIVFYFISNKITQPKNTTNTSSNIDLSTSSAKQQPNPFDSCKFDHPSILDEILTFRQEGVIENIKTEKEITHIVLTDSPLGTVDVNSNSDIILTDKNLKSPKIVRISDLKKGDFIIFNSVYECNTSSWNTESPGTMRIVGGPTPHEDQH